MAITSPPYWSVRRYSGGSTLGEEKTPEAYVEALAAELAELPRVLKPGGLALAQPRRHLPREEPRRHPVARSPSGCRTRAGSSGTRSSGTRSRATLTTRRTSSGTSTSTSFTSCARSATSTTPTRSERPRRRRASSTGRVVTPTGVSGVNYRRQIERSRALSLDEKAAALRALDDALARVRGGGLSDFRMLIRGQQRTTHSEVEEVSGRAAEIAKRGFCVLPYHPKGSKPGDVWQIVPEDTWRTDAHAAVFPADLCRIPILATCPEGGARSRPVRRHRHGACRGRRARPPGDRDRRQRGVPRSRPAPARSGKSTGRLSLSQPAASVIV